MLFFGEKGKLEQPGKNLPGQRKNKLNPYRAVFKWLSKVITWLRWVIGLKDSCQFFNQWEEKPKPIAQCTRDFSRASSELQVIARNCDWFIALFVPVVIGRSNCFGFGFSTVIWKPLYDSGSGNPTRATLVEGECSHSCANRALQKTFCVLAMQISVIVLLCRIYSSLYWSQN